MRWTGRAEMPQVETDVGLQYDSSLVRPATRPSHPCLINPPFLARIHSCSHPPSFRSKTLMPPRHSVVLICFVICFLATSPLPGIATSQEAKTALSRLPIEVDAQPAVSDSAKLVRLTFRQQEWLTAPVKQMGSKATDTKSRDMLSKLLSEKRK